ncbi:MAG: PQQ-binding-like beta-propeller repeat protein [Euryarchaeota archaeon]|nr:PQQ-binding-like beta-propeller repeat protein [Euryarchaeota archaeon]
MLVLGENVTDTADKELIEEEVFSFSDNPYQLGGGPMDSAWPMHCHDLHHTSQSPYSTAGNPGLEKWRFKCIGNTGHVNGGIIIGEDGTLYFGDSSWNVYALYPDGSLKWKYKTGGAISSSPALGEDGILYVGVWDDYLHAVYSTNGTRKWVFYANDANIHCAPTIALDGTIYVGTLWSLGNGGKVHAVNPDGTEKWRFQTGYAVSSSPALGDDGTIFFGSYDTYVYALYPNGTLKWQYKTGDQVRGSPSIATDGTIYIGSYDGYLYALYPNGTLKWRCSIGGYGTETNPAIGSDGTIYVGGQYLYAVNPDGTLKWSFNMGSGRRIQTSSPAISADGTIYVGTHIGDGRGGEIIAVNPDGTERWRKQIALDFIDSSPCIGEDGTVYIGSMYDNYRGYLHAFGPVQSNSPPGTPTITGEINGTIREEYWYIFTSVDPDNNPVTCYIDWGDGSAVESKDFASGEAGGASHTYTARGSYTIKAKARDTLGEESDWGTLSVTMPTSYNMPLLQFLELLFQRFPHVFPILRQMLGY